MDDLVESTEHKLLFTLVDMDSPDPEDRDEYLLLPLHKLRDYGKKVEKSYLEDAPKSESLNERSEKVAAESLASLEAAMDGTVVDEDADNAAGIEALKKAAETTDIAFTDKDKRSGGIRLSRIEKFLVESCDIDTVSIVFSWLGTQGFGALTTCAKPLYVRAKDAVFELYLPLSGFAKFSSNIRRGCKHGIVTGCDIKVGSEGEEVNINKLNSITAFFTKAVMQCELKSLTIRMDSSCNDISLRSFINSLSNRNSSNIKTLSLEGSGIQGGGMSILCEVMKSGALKNMTELNVSRNNCLYTGIHKLKVTIAKQVCPKLSTLRICGNNAKHAVRD